MECRDLGQDRGFACGGAYDLLGELELDAHARLEVQTMWERFLQSEGCRDAAGDALLAAIFEEAPDLQGLFQTALAVTAPRFVDALGAMVRCLDAPEQLKVLVESLAFQHMGLEVTPEHVATFRDALAGLLFSAYDSPGARDGWVALMDYVAGAFASLRACCTGRLRVVARTWAAASKRRDKPLADEESASDWDDAGKAPSACSSPPTSPRPPRRVGRGLEFGRLGPPADWEKEEGLEVPIFEVELFDEGLTRSRAAAAEYAQLADSFEEIFRFNATVMGLGGNTWMFEVLASFDAIVANLSNTCRFREEVEVLGLRLAKLKCPIDLADYKAVLLTSMRALMPKGWGVHQEVAWSWVWDNVALLLKAIPYPPHMRRSLEALWARLDQPSLGMLRREVYSRFFVQAPAGQEYFKQSATRLHFIGDLVRALTVDMYRNPAGTVQEIACIGLRHGGYGIPVELIAPFVSAWVQVVRKVTREDAAAEQAFTWSLNLVARIMRRTIAEGSNVLMRAINLDSPELLEQAVSPAPRGRRASWVLSVRVGTECMSPFMWALTSGRLEAARAILVDLLTIRADHANYYYGADELFERHPDVIQRLGIEAPALLPTLLDGLIWRSRRTHRGVRPVNYFVKHLIVSADGGFGRAVEWITDCGDPKIACHPAVSFVVHLLWDGAACRAFLAGKTWLLFCVAIFMSSQSILNRWEDTYGNMGERSAVEMIDTNPWGVRAAVFLMRIFFYTCCMGRWLQFHAHHMYSDWRLGNVRQGWGGIRVPAYLFDWQNTVSLALALTKVLMFMTCPILYCLGRTPWEQALAQRCEASRYVLRPYSIFSAAATVLYALLFMDVCTFSKRVSAFVWVCGRALSEVMLLLVGVLFTAVTFAAAISSLEQYSPDFAGLPMSAMSLLRITMGMFSNYEQFDDCPILLVAVAAYVVCTTTFLMNLLVAQLASVCRAAGQEMNGYACLNRGRIIVHIMPQVDGRRWHRFVEGLKLDQPIEFGDGEMGLPGGLRAFEPATAHPTTQDTIKRFGGSSSPSMPWPTAPARRTPQDRLQAMQRAAERSHKGLGDLLEVAQRNAHDGAWWLLATATACGGPGSDASTSASGEPVALHKCNHADYEVPSRTQI